MKKVVLPAICAAFQFMLMTACSKSERSEFTDSPIVEAYNSPGNVFSVKVSRQIPFATDVDYSDDDINQLAITVVKNDTSYLLTPVGEGVYTDSSIVVNEGDQYYLSFNYNNRDISAYTEVPAKPQNYTQSVTTIALERLDNSGTPPSGGGTMPDPVILDWTNDDGSYYLVVVENLETTLDPIRDFGDEEPPEFRFRKPPTNSSTLNLGPMEFQYFGTHRLILYHVLPDYAALYDENSTSSQNLTNPSSSVKNGYGIFTALNADTLYLEVTEQ